MIAAFEVDSMQSHYYGGPWPSSVFYIFMCNFIFKFFPSRTYISILYYAIVPAATPTCGGHNSTKAPHSGFWHGIRLKNSRQFPLSAKGVRKGGLGLNPPLSLIFYKNVITCAKKF